MAQEDDEEEIMEQLIALGYIDPGAGSPLWQAALAKVLHFFANIKSGVRKIFGGRTTASDSDDDE